MKTLKQILAEGEVIKGPWKGKPAEAPAAKFKSGHDAFKHFEKHHIEQSDGDSVTATDAYDAHCEHAEKHGFKPHTVDEFNHKMSSRGYVKQKTAGRIRYIGIKLKNHE